MRASSSGVSHFAPDIISFMAEVATANTIPHCGNGRQWSLRTNNKCTRPRVFSHGWIPVNTGRSSLRDWLIALFWSIDTRNVSLLHGTYFYRCFSGVDYWSRRLSVRIRHADVLYKNGSRSKSMDIMPKRYAYAPITCGACSKMSEGSHVLLAFTSPNAADILLTPSSQKKSIGAPPPPPTPPPIK